MTSFFFQSKSWYLTDELPQFNARISIEKITSSASLFLLGNSGPDYHKITF
jgi:hypothetical protein